MRSDAARKVATIADLLAIPEGYRRHEIIDGIQVEKAAASARASAATGRLARQLGPYDRRPGGRLPGGWWFATNVEVQLSDSYVFRPAVSGWRRERLDVLPGEVPVTVGPDWICEICSTNKHNDLIKKQRTYHLHQVRHYWLIDPFEETFAAYRWHSDGYVETLIAERQEVVRAEPFDAIQFQVGVLFGDDDNLELCHASWR